MHLYIHIPFCKVACHYCDFHFSTNLKFKDQLIEGIGQEIELQKNYLPNKNLKTIYFGGGTPSLLSEANLNLIFSQIESIYTIDINAEITLEANPDDITQENLKLWKAFGINRLSVGIQTFDENQLKYLNRSHNADQAKNCIEIAQKAGFHKFSIDLIYGIPSRSHKLWELDLKKVLDLNVEHISAYGLTIEPNTVFGNRAKKGLLEPVEDEFYTTQFQILRDTLLKKHFEHYEISNFAKNKAYASHNTSYWKAEPYLGVGPSAHSYKVDSRQYNISNNIKYLKAINKRETLFEKEILTENDKANDYILTTLRTMWGLNLNKLKEINMVFPGDFYSILNTYELENKITIENNLVKLTESGLLFADKIASDLFFV